MMTPLLVEDPTCSLLSPSLILGQGLLHHVHYKQEVMATVSEISTSLYDSHPRISGSRGMSIPLVNRCWRAGGRDMSKTSWNSGRRCVCVIDLWTQACICFSKRPCRAFMMHPPVFNSDCLNPKHYLLTIFTLYTQENESALHHKATPWKISGWSGSGACKTKNVCGFQEALLNLYTWTHTIPPCGQLLVSMWLKPNHITYSKFSYTK